VDISKVTGAVAAEDVDGDGAVDTAGAAAGVEMGCAVDMSRVTGELF